MSKYAGWFLFVAPLLIMGIANLMAWNHLGERVPTHWNIRGEPDAWGGRGSIWIIPILYFWIAGFMQLMALRLPGSSEPSHHRSIQWIATGIAVLFLLLYAEMLITALKPTEMGSLPFLSWGLAALTICLGLGLKSCKRNGMIGIRTKWTMASDEIWDKTHRLASSLFIAAGIGMSFASFWVSPPILVGVLLASCLVPAFYSYHLHKSSRISP